MSILAPEFEIVDRTEHSIRYLQHGWPTDLCRWHSHEELELHLITETRGKAFVGDYIGEFVPGSLFLVGPHLPHNWITDEFVACKPTPLRDMLVQFNLQTIATLQSAFPEFKDFDDLLKRSVVGLEFIDFDAGFAQRKMAEIRDTKGSERILNFLTLLTAVNKHPQQKSLSVANLAGPKFNAKSDKIGRVIDHIIDNFADDINLEKAAEMSNLSATAFARNFQKQTGSKFVEFVNRVRIGQACSMLQETDEKVATICHEVGFRNLANFNRHFLRVKHTTPSAYRSYMRAELYNRPAIQQAADQLAATQQPATQQASKPT